MPGFSDHVFLPILTPSIHFGIGIGRFCGGVVAPQALGLQLLGDFRRHVGLVVLGKNAVGAEDAVGRERPSATTPCPSRNRSGRTPV